MDGVAEPHAMQGVLDHLTGRPRILEPGADSFTQRFRYFGQPWLLREDLNLFLRHESSST
jgi:hypothetical protein